MLVRLRNRLTRLLAAVLHRGRTRVPPPAAHTRLPLPVTAELECFDRLVRRLGMRPDGAAGNAAGAGPAEPAGWRPELTRVKAQRHRVLAALEQAAGVPPERRREVEACLLQGWHLVFHCYAMATGLLPDDGPEDLQVKREDLRRVYAAGLENLTASGRV